jgi:hypothetical protein
LLWPATGKILKQSAGNSAEIRSAEAIDLIFRFPLVFHPG